LQAGIGMSLDLFPYLAYLFLQYFLHFVIDHQVALSRSPFQTALDHQLSADSPICTLLRVEANAILHQL
jgi:hypothetical protein